MVTLFLLIDTDPIFFRYQPKIGIKSNSFYKIKIGELKINCQPVAINAGYVWPKKGLKHSNKAITISILKPIAAGHSKEEFTKILESNIYKELNLLN